MNFSASSETTEVQPRAPRLKVPRIESLDHRLRRAKDADGRPVPIRDELLFFLEDPPQGTGDRWEKGAELCRSHGIETSRMAVWRFYRGHVLEWRRAQIPASKSAPDPKETALLHEQVRHLAAQRALEMLNDPALSPGHLIGLLQNDNHRQKLQLARDQFADQLEVRRVQERRDWIKRVDDEAREKAIRATSGLFLRALVSRPRPASVPPHTTSSRNIPGTPSGGPK